MVIDIFANKLLQLPDYNRRVILCFDEFFISPKIEYSLQHKSWIGLPTLKPQYLDSKVQNCFIIMAQCLTLPIRVPVSVDFTTHVTRANISVACFLYYIIRK